MDDSTAGARPSLLSLAGERLIAAGFPFKGELAVVVSVLFETADYAAVCAIACDLKCLRANGALVCFQFDFSSSG
jgi:hypothetical protein